MGEGAEQDAAQRVRNAALNLMVAPVQIPEAQVIADRSGVPLETVAQHMPTDEATYTFLIRPMVDALDQRLRALPIRQQPTISDQRAVLDATLTAIVDYPRQLGLALHWLTDHDSKHRFLRADTISYQIAVRLLGADYDRDSDQVTRIVLVSELLKVAALSRNHQLGDLRERRILIESMLAILNPSPEARGEEPVRRWTDDTQSPDA